MKFLKTFIYSCCKPLVAASLLLMISLPLTGQNTVKLYLFWAKGCGHCKKEKKFLESLAQQYGDKLKITDFEVTKNKKHADLLEKTGQKLNVKIPGVPFTVVGENYFVGWDREETTGVELKRAIDKCLQNPCPDIVRGLMIRSAIYKGSLQQDSIPETIKAPVIGEIKTKDLSLPIITVIIAAVDGFNPCAMWALLFLISLLLPMENKRRKWILGFTFIFTSAIVYYIFMAAWLNLFLFIGFIFWIRLLVGLVALYAAYHYIREYITNPEGACEVSEGEKKKKFFSKLKSIVERKNIWISLAGIIALSFSVNLIEMICSAGLPAIYTGILSANDLPSVQYYLYMGLYISIFLLDDLIVYTVAMATLQTTGFSAKYTRTSQLIGGMVMLIVGLLLIFKPEWLMFG